MDQRRDALRLIRFEHWKQYQDEEAEKYLLELTLTETETSSYLQRLSACMVLPFSKGACTTLLEIKLGQTYLARFITEYFMKLKDQLSSECA